MRALLPCMQLDFAKTLITLVMFPILLVMYTRLALGEESEVRARVAHP